MVIHCAKRPLDGVAGHRKSKHIRRPWGEQFVQEFYNRYETQYPIIDNITNEFEAMRFGFAAEGAVGASGGVFQFVKFIALRESAEQAKQLLGGDGGRVVWDVKAERAKGAEFLVQSLATNDPIRGLVAADREAAAAFVADKQQLTDAEIRDICDMRHSRQGGSTECAGTNLGAIAAGATTKRDAMFKAHLNGLNRIPKVLIYSHTHAAERFRLSKPDVDVYNTGAWQRLVTPEAIRKLAAGKKMSAVLSGLKPENLDACYSFVLVPPYADVPKAELQSWVVDAAGMGANRKKLCH